MGEHADDALEMTLDEEHQRMLWRIGEMNSGDAYDQGIIDETGAEIGPETGKDQS